MTRQDSASPEQELFEALANLGLRPIARNEHGVILGGDDEWDALEVAPLHVDHPKQEGDHPRP